MGFLPARRCQSSPGGTVVENRASGTGQQGQDQKHHERLVQPRDTGISVPVGWHTLRHSFGTLMKANGEDIKTIQELLRHATFKVTADTYTQAVTPVKRNAHARVAKLIMAD